MDAKDALRRQVRARRSQLGREEMERLGAALGHALCQMPCYRQARRVLLYCSLPLEIGTHQLMEQVWREGKTLYLPRCEPGRSLSLCQVNGWQDLQPGAYGIDEPGPGCPVETPERMELAVVPALACDGDGYRLGQGAGYYDRLLPRLVCPTVAFCQGEFLVDRLPRDEFDVPCRWICTQDGVKAAHAQG